MTPGKKYGRLLILGLVAAAGIFSLFFHMYRKDIRALEDFVAAYRRFDMIMATHPEGGRPSTRDEAAEAAARLQAKASLGLSSLIRNDAELMKLALEVADFSRQEVDALRALDVFCSSRSQNRDSAEAAEQAKLEEAYEAIREKRSAAYARFWEFSGLKD